MGAEFVVKWTGFDMWARRCVRWVQGLLLTGIGLLMWVNSGQRQRGVLGGTGFDMWVMLVKGCV